MSEDERSSHEPELRFGSPSEQELERSRNLKLIVGLLVGPTLILGILGYGDAAVTVFLCSVGAVMYFAMASFRRQPLWDHDDEDKPIELGLEQRRATAKPKGFLALVKTNFKR